MRAFTSGGTVIDKCERCHGIWFDEKEIGAFKESLKGLDPGSIEVPTTDESGGPLAESCPRCKETLRDFTYAYDSRVRPKRCDGCQGIWLPVEQLLELVKLAKHEHALHADAVGMANGIEGLERARKKAALAPRYPSIFVRLLALAAFSAVLHWIASNV